MVVQIPTKDQDDFGRVKAALLQLHGIDSQAFRVRWLSIKRKPGESSQEIAQRGKMLYESWTAGADTVEMINNLIMTEQLIKTFPDHIQTWLRDQQLTEPLAAGRLADDHLRNLEGQIDDRRNKFGG